MGKTIRRKDIAGSGGYYEHLNTERNHHKAAENYIHSDMPSRNGRWTHSRFLKVASATARRTESRGLSSKIIQAGDVDELFVPKDDQASRCKADPWYEY